MDPPFSSAGDAPHQRPPLPARPSTSARPTIAITPIDIQTLSFPDGSRDTFPVRTDGSIPSPLTTAAVAEDGDDAISVASSAPNPRPAGDTVSVLGGGGGSRSGPAWASLLRSRSGAAVPPPPPESLLSLSSSSDGSLAGFEHEFDSLPDRKVSGSMDDDGRLQLWKSKLKHYMILSSAGKPIYSRHGDLELINASMGVIQTIISFYEASQDRLLGFTAGDARFVVLTEGPLYLVAVSRLRESDSQLRAQLDALYMQILSTLTLPTLTRIFANRPSTDLRRPLDGTEPLLSSLADSFTRGSASALLGGLECLRLRKTHRHGIDSVLLSLRSDRLLYGMLVAGGKLVSVVRPRRHSLHPGDLQLVFNMLFESGGIKAGGGENWIPLCLPSFNNQGYLYMYVSFFDGADGEQATASSAQSEHETVAMILISADKESFYSLKQMRDDVAGQLGKTGSLAVVLAAVRAGRPRVQDVAPGSQIRHFVYKSRSNVQFCMSSLSPGFSGLLPRRRLMTVYHQLHAAVHERHHQVKVTHCVSEGATSLGWITPLFELYCIGGPHTSRAAMTQGADQIVQWAKREEERLFIIGGGVF